MAVMALIMISLKAEMETPPHDGGAHLCMVWESGMVWFAIHYNIQCPLWFSLPPTILHVDAFSHVPCRGNYLTARGVWLLGGAG